MSDEYVPKISTKPEPESRKRKMKRIYDKRPANSRPSQKDRSAAYARELKKLNIHKPTGTLTAKDVKTMKDLQKHLRETWHTIYANANNFRYFTPKQIEFARQYAINGRTNKSQAMRLAGYDTGNPDKLVKMANINLRKPHMDELITAFELEEKARMKINVEDVVQWFNRIATSAMETGDFTNANRAMENLAKYLGMFVEKKEITHKTIYSREDLDTRIAELTAILKEAEPEIERKLRIN